MTDASFYLGMCIGFILGFILCTGEMWLIELLEEAGFRKWVKKKLKVEPTCGEAKSSKRGYK